MVVLNSSSCNFGWKPDNLDFVSLRGKKNTLYNLCGLNGILIMFICNHCPYVRSIEKKIAIEIMTGAIIDFDQSVLGGGEMPKPPPNLI